MPISATTNASSIVAQRNIAISSDDNSKAMAALSSGSRITRASDGAAEAAIGAKLRSTVSVLSQASRNTSQGASLIQVATDALKNTSNLLTRMKTLTAQVINGSLSDSDKMMVREEFLKLKDLVDNISSQTRWNGISMLGGGAGKAVLERADATVSGSAASVDDPSNVTATYVTAIATADLTGSINGKLASLDVGDYTNGVISAGSISLKMQNGEEFRNEGVVQVTNSGSFKLVSLSNKDNIITINFGADAETGITTLGTFKSKVEAVFQGAVFSGSAQAASGAASNVAADATNGFTSGGSTIAGFVSGLVKDAVVTQDGSKFKVSVTIGNQTFQSTVLAMSNYGTLTLVAHLMVKTESFSQANLQPQPLWIQPQNSTTA